jgi:magnesium-transporting ATPase (P-type)
MASTPIYSWRPAEVYDALTTLPEGLSSGEVAARRELYGPNLLSEEPGLTNWQKLFPLIFHPLAGMLWLAGAIALATREPVLGIVIWVLVLVNTGFSYWRERRTEKAIEALRRLLPVYARLTRDGIEQKIPVSELVPGDVLILSEGDNIPADARIVEAYGLRTNNAVLTGEAIPALKSADASLQGGISDLERPNLVFAGTSVVSGTGRAVVYATGMLTQFGRIAHLTQAIQEQASPIQVELLRLTRRISLIALAIGIIVFSVSAFDLGMDLYEAFLLALGIIVAAVPEGLPATLTLTLAMAGQRLAQHKVLVKKLSVIETLGTVSMICADKSGTLTQNQMTVRDIWTCNGRWRLTGGGYDPEGEIVPVNGSKPGRNGLDFLLLAATLCNNSRLNPPDNSKVRWSALGDQTEAAMRVAALKGGVSEESIHGALPRIHELPFEARRKRMSTIHELSNINHLNGMKKWLDVGEGNRVNSHEVAFIKGAPREIVELCTQAVVGNEISPLDNLLRSKIFAQIDVYARQGLRILALAYRRLPPRTGSYTPATIEHDLIFLGLMAMLDPARPDVANAVQICKQAGIRMVMITGDYGLTAESLARRIGMLTSHNAKIITGGELDGLNDEQLHALLDEEVVFARMAPEHKLRLVGAYQSRGEVVAVTGDGVNDAPALRKADVGVAMGVTGTDVAKEAADVILVEDNFAAIIDAIQEGRSVYDNLRKFISYVFSSNVPEIFPFLLTALFKIPLALTVRQILAIDLGTDILPGLALGMEKPEPDIMTRKPRQRNQPVIDRSLLMRAFLWLGPIETVLAFSGYILVNILPGQSSTLPAGLHMIASKFDLLPNQTLPLLATTIYHAGVVLAQVGNAFASRSESNRSRSLGWFSNRFLVTGVLVEIGLITALIYFHPLAIIFQHLPLPPVFWLWLGVYPLVLYGLEWLRKKWVRQIKRKEEVSKLS